MKRFAWALCLLSLSAARLSLAGTAEPFDFEEQLRPLARQRQAPPLAVNALLAPSSSAPALAAWDEPFALTLVLPSARTGGRADGWRVWAKTRIRAPYGAWLGSAVQQEIELPVERLEPGPMPGLLRLWVRVPARSPREVFHLEVHGPYGLVARRPHALRVLGDRQAGPGLRFAVLADSQLRDPSTRFEQGALNNDSYPRRGASLPERMLLQQVEELDFFDPDFVLYLGDLLFGLDYRKEYPQTLQLWWSRPLAAFMVPGNHDGMALYELALREGWWSEVLGSVRCARILLDGELNAAKVFAALACLVGDLKKILFEDLQQDGLDYWRRYLGATGASAELDENWRLLTLNSYAGSPERRHGFVLGLGFAGLDLGVATVDNYGGSLSERQLAWLGRELDRAEAEGRHVLLAMHHDPRGKAGAAWGRRYHANLPFPTEPIGLRSFQEWNYDGPDWDSDPADGRAEETQTDNSATRLLRLVAGRVNAIFSGHLHADRDQLAAAGSELVVGSGLQTPEPLRFCRVTSASATPADEGGYWGFRLIRTRLDGGLDGVFCDRARNWASWPSGNLWFEGDGHARADGLVYRIHNGLPRTVEGRLRVYLPERLEGYRFTLRGPGRARLVDLGRGAEGRAVYYVRLEMPGVEGQGAPPPPGREPVAELRVEPAVGNRLPVVDFQVEPAEPAPGQRVRLTYSGTRDPEGRELLAHVWDFGDGRSARGAEVEHRFAKAGRYPISLTVIDAQGAFARHATRLEVRPATPACAQAPNTTSPSWVVCLALGLSGLFLARRRFRSR